MKNIINELTEQIRKAEEQAILKGIKTNAIILNSEFDFSKEFAIMESIADTIEGGKRIPPMILGKKVFVGKLPKEYSFALFETPYETELEQYKRKCEQLEAQLKKVKEALGIEEDEQ